MSDALTALKQEATELGIKFSPNISESKLKDKIDEFYESQNTVEQDIQEAMSAQEQHDVAMKAESDKNLKRKKTMREKAKEAEAEARKTRIVEIIDNDSRVNSQTTTCTATAGNMYFDLGTVILPLNTPVEVAIGHINTLKEVTYPFHKLDSKTGLANVEMRKRYTISYVQ